MTPRWSVGLSLASILLLAGCPGGKALLGLSDAPSYDFGLLAVGASADHAFTITNTGSQEATSMGPAGALSSAFTFRGGTYPGTGGNCGDSLAAGAACSVVVTFSPGTSGPVEGTLSLGYHDGAATQVASRGLKGSGTTFALLAINDWSGEGGGIGGLFYDYGVLGVGATASHTFTVVNRGGGEARGLAAGTLPAPFAFAGGSYPGTGGTCGTSLAAGASCTLAVVFAPVAPETSHGALSLDYHDGAAPRTVTRALAGRGTSQAYLFISDRPGGDGANRAGFDYGVHGLPVDHTFHVFNSGALPATVVAGSTLGAPFSFKGGTYPGTGGNCGTSLAAGTSCAVVVTFTPDGLSTTAGELNIQYHDGAATRAASRDLTGTGTTRALLQIWDETSLPVDFGTAGSPVQRFLRVWNVGAQAAGLEAAGELGNDFGFHGGTYPGTGGDCGTWLTAGSYCYVAVTFTPAGSGPRSSTFTLSYRDASGVQTAARVLSGTATELALLTISPWWGDSGNDSSAWDYATAGFPVDHTFTVINKGGQAAMALGDGGGLGGDFSFKDGAYPGTGGDCGSSLGAGSDCSVVVTFTPSGAGPRSSVIRLSYHDDVATRSAARGVTGTATGVAVLSVSPWWSGIEPSGPYYYGTSGVPVDGTFFVFNSGAQAATSLGDGGGLGNGFSFKGGTYPGTGGTCGTSLEVRQYCSLVVTFTPSGVGPRASALAVSYDDGGATRLATCNVTAAATDLALVSIVDRLGGTSPLPTPFKYWMASHPVDNTFYVQNLGARAATALGDGGGLANDFGFKGGTYPGTGGTCGTSLAAGDTCTLVVTFSPSGTGYRWGTTTLSFHDGATTRTVTRDVSGYATGPLSINDGPSPNYSSYPPHEFGTSGVPRDATLYVFNDNAWEPVTGLRDGGGLTNNFGFKGGTYPGTGGTCGTSLLPQEFCTVVLTFTPSGSGLRTSTLTLAYDYQSTAYTATRNVTGTATANAYLVISDPAGRDSRDFYPYDFGTAGVPRDATFQVANQGAQAATALGDGGRLTNGFGFKGGAYPGTGGTCGASLASGSNCTVVVTFTPSGSGQRSSVVALAYHNRTSTAVVVRQVIATATDLALVIIADSPDAVSAPYYIYYYGTADSPVDATFYAVNNGAQAATALGDAGTLNNGFAFKGGTYPGTGGTCGATLEAGTSCSIVVTFTPSGSGLRTSTLSLTYHDGVSPLSADRGVNGMANTGG